MWGVCRRLLLH